MWYGDGMSTPMVVEAYNYTDVEPGEIHAWIGEDLIVVMVTLESTPVPHPAGDVYRTIGKAVDFISQIDMN